MATVFSKYAFDYRTINMHILISNQTDFTFYDNYNAVYNGITYQDVAVFDYYDNGSYEGIFGGHDVKFNSAGTDVISGTATGYLQVGWNGSAWVPIWGVQNFSYSASALADAIQSVTTTDDFAVIAQVLSGNDILFMSPYADLARGYAGNDTLIGYGGNDILYGEAGADVLNGHVGADFLSGGSGKDVFFFSTKLSAANIDRISDFNHADDTIDLDDDIFTKLNTGVQHSLTIAQYKENSTGLATDADDRIIYNNVTGALYYDADGNGPTAAIQFAVVSGGPDEVDQTDFLVVI
jgi:Ca2+-binding RTX toxin-like protein